MKRFYYEDIITAAMMFKHHGIRYKKPSSAKKAQVPAQKKIKEMQVMAKQVAYNLELTRGDNNDFFDWVFRARSFHDSAMILVSLLEGNDLIQLPASINTYTINPDNPVSIYPSFFYIAAHSIELLLKAIAIFSGCSYIDVRRCNHDLEQIKVMIGKTGFDLPKFTKGQKVILSSMSMTIGTGAVKYPNGNKNTQDIYKAIANLILGADT